MVCQVDPPTVEALAEALDAVSLPYLFAGIVLGAGGLFLVAYLYGVYRGE